MIRNAERTTQFGFILGSEVALSGDQRYEQWWSEIESNWGAEYIGLPKEIGVIKI